VAWFLLDADDDVKEHIMRNFSKRELGSYQSASELLHRNNAERLNEGRQRVLRVLRALAENGDIIPRKSPG
jgi:flagellar motor switch protein FliG